MEIRHKINKHILGCETPHLYTGRMRVGGSEPVTSINLLGLASRKIVPQDSRITSRDSTFIGAGINQSKDRDAFVGMRIDYCDLQPGTRDIVVT